MANTPMDPLEFRFTDPGDVALYGDRWYLYDEAALIRLPARSLIELENELGMTVVDMMNGVRVSSTLGDLAAAWLGVRAADPAVAGTFDGFNPLVLTLDWRKAEAPGKDDTAETDMPPPPAAQHYRALDPPLYATSDRTGSVALPTLPVAE